MNEYVDRRYALALYQVAEEKGKVEQFVDELKNVAGLINNDKDFQLLIQHPQVSTSNKKKMFEDLFKNKIESDVLSFLGLLIEKGRIRELESMLSQMEKIYLEKHNTSIARVVTVLPLLEEEKSELIDKLQKKYNKKILLQEELDSDILGGVYVWIDNEVIDGTVRSKIEEMKKLMLKRE
jgi:F-type H+-transporting ATPase subunit delta